MENTDLKIKIVNYTGEETEGLKWAKQIILDYVLKNFFEVEASTGITVQHWETASSGYAAVWARDNTRKDLFDSMRRKEVYATTGPRMTVRFFGGWDFAADAIERVASLNGRQIRGVGGALATPLTLACRPRWAPGARCTQS